MKRLSVLLITAALIAGMAGCDYTAPSKDLEIRTWYDLDAVRDNLAGNHILMNDLDSTTLGYEELASPTANQGKGWEPIGFIEYIFWDSPGGGGGSREDWYGFNGTFDGQGYKIRDLYIDRPDEINVGVFGAVDGAGVIRDIGAKNVTVIGENDVGGLLGRNRGTVSNSYFSGNVAGDSGVGGLVGVNDGTVSNSYSTGDVTGSYAVGGLVGGNGGTVSNSYSTGNVTGGSYVGGLVGYNESEGNVSNSFWDIQTSGQAASDGGTGKNTTEMQNIVTFSDAEWSIIAVALNETNPAYIWNIVNGVTYPFLSWQP